MSFPIFALLKFSFKFFHGDRDTVTATSQQNHFSVADNERATRQRADVLTGPTEPSSGSGIAWPLGDSFNTGKKYLSHNLHLWRGYLAEAREFVCLPNRLVVKET